MWSDLLTALCLVMVLEGLLPFISPDISRKMAAMVSQLDNKNLRVSGLMSMLCGVLLLSLIH